MAEKNLGKVAVTTGGTYASSKAYDKLTIVNHNGASWISKTAVPAGNAPSESSSYWQLLLGASVPRIAMTSTSASINPNTFYVWGEMASLDITLNEGASAEENRYMFQFRNPKSGATVLTLPDDILWSVDTELGDDGLPLFGKGEYTRIEIIEGLASVKKWALPYIIFADAEVERVLLANGVGDGTGITKREAKGVTSIGTWFRNNTTITSFRELQYFTGVTDLGGYAFNGCSSLKVLDARNIVNIGNYALTSLPIQELNLNTENIKTIGTDGLRGLKCLPSQISMPNLSSLGAGNAFRDSNVEEVLDLGIVTDITPYTFYNCSSLKVLHIPSTCTNFGAQACAYCKALQSVVCRAVTPPTLHLQTFMSANSTFTIYVPDESVEAYKTATNWSSYAARIKGISELPTE